MTAHAIAPPSAETRIRELEEKNERLRVIIVRASELVEHAAGADTEKEEAIYLLQASDLLEYGPAATPVPALSMDLRWLLDEIAGARGVFASIENLTRERVPAAQVVERLREIRGIARARRRSLESVLRMAPDDGD